MPKTSSSVPLFRVRSLAIALIVMLVSLTVGACSRGGTQQQATDAKVFSGPVTITNCERETTYEKAPQRIVSMNFHVTETLIQMGLGDRIIATGQAQRAALPEVVAEAKEIPHTWKEYPSAEEIRDLEPDIVIAGMSSAFRDGRGRDALEDLGIHTFLFSEYCGKGFPDIALLKKDFAQLGKVLGVEGQAQTLVDRITGDLARIQKNLDEAGVKPVKTFFYDSGEDQPMTVGGVGIGNLVGEYAGAKNITAEGNKPYFDSSWETIGERAPEAIVVLSYGSRGNDSAKEKIEYLKNQPIMQTTPAVKNERFVVVQLDNMFESSRMVKAAETIARGLHPEAFAGKGQ